MSAAETVRYRWLQTGGPWTEATDLAEVEWTDIDADLVPVSIPLAVQKQEGPTPNTLHFQVRAAGKISPPGDGAYGAENIAAVATRRRPDGTDGNMYYPVVGSANSPKELELVQLMDAPALADKDEGVSRFVGIVTELHFSSDPDGGDMWDVTVSEIARWHMGRIGVYGAALRKYDNGGNVWQANAAPVFNAEGRADQHGYIVTGNPTPQERFINENHNSVDGVPIDNTHVYAGYWRLGEMLNCLHREYNQAGGNGAVSTANYLAWALAVPDTKWDFLFTEPVSGEDQVAKDFALGGMDLARAIDHIVTRAGRFGWTCEWNPTTFLYDLIIFDAVAGDGDTPLTYDRGALGGAVGSTPPAVLAVDLRYSWDNAATRVKALGGKKRWEFTADITAGTLENGWTAAQKTAYDGDKDNGHKYPSVYQRFVLADDIDWSAVFGHANFLSGRRRTFPYILSSVFASDAETSDAPVRLHVHAWRYKSGSWEPAPDGVSVHVNSADGSIHVTGKAKDEDARWGENGSDTAYPVRVTVAVEDDARLTTAAAVEDKPTGWPTLEAVMDDPNYIHEGRAGAYLPTDGSGHPVIDNPATHESLTDTIRDDTARLKAAATRTLKARSRPSLAGSITVKDILWTVVPGRLIGALTGSGRTTLTLNAVVQGVTYSLVEGQEAMTLNLRGDTV